MKKQKREYLIEKHEAENRALARRLRAAGCPVPAEDDSSLEPDLAITVSNSEQTRAYDSRRGTEYVFAVRITSNSYARLYVQKFKCRLPWPAPDPIWLGDPRIHSLETEVYRLPSGREFPCDTVLNHCVGELGKLEPLESREGTLLAFSDRRIDDECLHGSPFPAEIVIFDQYGRRHSSVVEVVADRTATIHWASLNHRGKGLYDDGCEAGESNFVSGTALATPIPNSEPDPADGQAAASQLHSDRRSDFEPTHWGTEDEA